MQCTLMQKFQGCRILKLKISYHYFRAEIQAVEKQHVIPIMFQEVYARIEKGSASWQALKAPETTLYPWDEISTYIKRPPFFDGMTRVSHKKNSWARCL